MVFLSKDSKRRYHINASSFFSCLCLSPEEASFCTVIFRAVLARCRVIANQIRPYSCGLSICGNTKRSDSDHVGLTVMVSHKIT